MSRFTVVEKLKLDKHGNVHLLTKAEAHRFHWGILFKVCVFGALLFSPAVNDTLS